MRKIEKRVTELERMLVAMFKTVLTTREAAEYIGVSYGRMRHLVAEKMVPYYKRGAKVYLRKDELETWMLQGERVEALEDMDLRVSSRIALERLMDRGAGRRGGWR